MDMTHPARAQPPRPTQPSRPQLSEERLAALAADLAQAFARIARRRF
jgi:hypothetical protein